MNELGSARGARPLVSAWSATDHVSHPDRDGAEIKGPTLIVANRSGLAGSGYAIADLLTGDAAPIPPEPASGQGGNRAQLTAEQAYRQGLHCARSNDPDAATKAAQFFKMGAQQGHARANLHLATCYETGTGVAQSLSRAVEHYRYAAQGGIVGAQIRLASFLKWGMGAEKDLIESFHWFSVAAGNGNSMARLRLAGFYEDPNVVPVPHQADGLKLAFSIYSELARDGNEGAQSRLGKCYEYGRGVGVDLGLAVHWYQEAAKQGHIDGLYRLASFYKRGLVVKPDYEKSIALLEESARGGHLFAQYHLALELWRDKQHADRPRQAIAWMQTAAANGVEDAEAWLKQSMLAPPEADAMEAPGGALLPPMIFGNPTSW
jgi:TPR repeat protein